MNQLFYVALLCTLISCSNNSKLRHYKNLNEQTTVQLDNANRSLINYMDRQSLEKPAKYGPAYLQMKKHLSTYDSIVSNDVICIKSFKSFIAILKKESSIQFPHILQPIDNCFKDSKVNLQDSLTISGIRLNVVSAFHDFLLNFSGEFFGGAYKFIAIHDFPISQEDNRYSFSLINKIFKSTQIKTSQ